MNEQVFKAAVDSLQDLTPAQLRVELALYTLLLEAFNELPSTSMFPLQRTGEGTTPSERARAMVQFIEAEIASRPHR